MSTSTTSTQTYSSASSSSPRDIQQAVTEASLPQPHVGPQPANKISFIEKWAIPIMGMVLAGVAAYFFAFVAVKEDISTNRQDIVILRNDLGYMSDKLSDLKNDVSQSKNNNSDILVLKTKVENLEYNLKEHNTISK
jgi:hypothetical protein